MPTGWKGSWSSIELSFFAVIGVALATFFSCGPSAEQPRPQNRVERDLRITFGGFPQGHPEEGKVDGVCGTDFTRNVLDCDIHNGLAAWTVTELTLEITWYPYEDDNRRLYSERISIEPQKTQHVSIRLGLRLPPDEQLKVRGRPVGKPQSQWQFLIANAKGYRVQ
jgi:hypothetical protein